MAACAHRGLSTNGPCAWCEELGQETFVGTSGGVFPKAMKSSPLLRAWLRRLAALNVAFKPRHRWAGWDAEGGLLFDTPDGRVLAAAGAAIFALGGASWPRLGLDGHWTAHFASRGIAVSPLKPANCGFATDLSDLFRARFEGQPLMGIELRFEGASVRGDAIVTKTGLEGGAIYALSAPLRDAIERDGEAIPMIDLRPGLAVAELERALAKPRGKQSFSNVLRKAVKLSPAAAGLLQEAAFRAGVLLASWMLGGTRRADQSRSRLPHGHRRHPAGHLDRRRIAFAELDGRFMLRRMPGTFAAGEMLDWVALTGRFPPQACFSTGAAAASGAIAWLQEGGR